MATPLATCWLEAHTLCVISNDEARDEKKLERHFDMLQNILKDQHCCLVELKHTNDYPLEVKDLITGRLDKICRALAIVVRSEARNEEAVQFLKNYPGKKIPVKLFTSEKAARIWLAKMWIKRKQQVS
jgi:hypothetical protein